MVLWPLGAVRPYERKTMQTHKKELTRAALVARINRHLKKENCTLHKTRGARWLQEYGEYYITNDRNVMCDADVDLEQYAKDNALMAPGERLTE